MNTVRALTALTLLFVLSACATKPQQPPANVPKHDALPREFSLAYTSWDGGRTLTYEKGYLVRRTYETRGKGLRQEDIPLKTEYIVPTREQWLEFWKAADAMKLWSWKKVYLPRHVGMKIFDGGTWRLVARYKGRSIDTRGENAGPKPGNPQKTIIGWYEWNDQIEDAVEILLKKPRRQ